MSQVDGNGVQPGGGLGTHFVQRPCLPLDDRRLIDLEDCGARRPGQAVGAGVQTGGQDDHLAHTCRARIGEVVVDQPGSHRHHPGHARHAEAAAVVHLIGVELAAGQTSEEVNSHRAHQRLGEGVVDQRIGCSAGQRASHRHAGSGGTDAGCQIPSVVI